MRLLQYIKAENAGSGIELFSLEIVEAATCLYSFVSCGSSKTGIKWWMKLKHSTVKVVQSYQGPNNEKGKFIGSKLGKGLMLTLSLMNASIRTCRYTAPYIVFKHFLLCQQCCGRNLCFNAQCYTKELTICWLSSKLTTWILKFIYNKFLHYLCPYVNLCNPKLMIQMHGSESNLTKLAKDQLS